MSVILYVLGGLAVMLGAALVGFGIPIKEFGIGNTLILSGTVVFCTGLLLVALATAITHLVRLTDLLASRAPVRDARPLEPFDRLAGAPTATGGQESRIPFPPRPKSAGSPPIAESRVRAGGEEPPAAGQSPSLAPSLRNPDLAAVDPGKDHEPAKPAEPELPPPELNLPPPPPLPSTISRPSEPQMPPPPPRPAPTMRPPQPNYFDTVWPADGKPEIKPDKKLNGDGEFRPVPRFEPAASEPPPLTADVPLPLPEPANEEKRAAAVLKSGVVDGMAYTLYVDGSIEAELPQGTLRFASINDLREHLERGGA
ncbi:MAG: hypothetical protein AB7O50_01460 [Pseudolabrys sp.]